MWYLSKIDLGYPGYVSRDPLQFINLHWNASLTQPNPM